MVFLEFACLLATAKLISSSLQQLIVVVCVCVCMVSVCVWMKMDRESCWVNQPCLVSD